MTTPQVPPTADAAASEPAAYALLRSALRREYGTDDRTMARLRAQLATRAAGAGLLDVAYAVTDSPLGPLLLAATPAGLVRVAYEVEDHDAVVARLAARIGPGLLRSPGALDPVRRQLEEYFDGRRQVFDLALDLQLSSGFRREVLRATAGLPYGTTASYAAVATATGRGAAVRATGTALATNPVPIVVPCHRVLRSDATLGGYVGGLPAKQALLDLERRQSPARAAT